MKFLKYAGIGLGIVLLVAALGYPFRRDPIGPLAGKQLSGSEAPYPDSWSVCDDHQTIAVETRPEDPHSVTTVCFVHGGELIIPAMNGSGKEWPAIVAADPRVRIKIGDAVYRAQATRAMDLTIEDVIESAARKYPQFRDRDPSEAPPDVWLFRIGPR